MLSYTLPAALAVLALCADGPPSHYPLSDVHVTYLEGVGYHGHTAIVTIEVDFGERSIVATERINEEQRTRSATLAQGRLTQILERLYSANILWMPENLALVKRVSVDDQGRVSQVVSTSIHSRVSQLETRIGEFNHRIKFREGSNPPVQLREFTECLKALAVETVGIDFEPLPVCSDAFSTAEVKQSSDSGTAR